MNLIISEVGIKQDSEGRFCLNDLHRAAGGDDKHRPTYWMKNQSTNDLIKELAIDGIPSIESKQGLGTFVCKELVYAYAMWISPSFHLKVIRTFDVVQNKQPLIPQTLPEALRLAADLAEQNNHLIAHVSKIEPKAAVADKIADTQGLFGFRHVAKILHQKEKDLSDWLMKHKWCYRAHNKGPLLGYKEKFETGYLDHKVAVVPGLDGRDKDVCQIQFTGKGVCRLCAIFNITPPELAAA